MTKRIVEGFWDCPYCGRKSIGGLTKTCPSCGKPQGKGIKFYMTEEKRYLDDEQAENYGKGADWQCDFCGSYNRYFSTNCRNCGSPKSSSKKDYFGKSIGDSESLESKTIVEDTHSNNSPKDDDVPDDEGINNHSFSTDDVSTKRKQRKADFFQTMDLKSFSKPLSIGLGLLFLISLLIFIFYPREYEAYVASNSWNRSISIESYEWVDDSRWYSAPSGARNVSYEDKIHHYDEVFDHYEYVRVKKSREVYDHTEIEKHTSYIDNGDGTFTEETYTEEKPVYRTEDYYEIEKKEVNRQEPVYARRYYYQIQKWVFNRTEKASGKNEYEFHWPKYSLRDNERVSGKYEGYNIKFISVKDNKEYNVKVPESYLEKFKLEQKVKITVQGGLVTKINSEKIVF